MRFTATSAEDPRPVAGLLLLSSDETLEQDARAALPARDMIVHTSRVVTAETVSTESLGAMARTLTDGARNLPSAPTYGVIGYGCTSATAVMGSDKVTELVRAGRACAHVTTPLDALIAYAQSHGLKQWAVLSPYVPEVSQTLLDALNARGLDTPVFGSFDEPSEAAVARISAGSVQEAGAALMAGADVDALFLSCTNLPTQGLLGPMSEAIGKPVVSSNSVLLWHMGQLLAAGS